MRAWWLAGTFGVMSLALLAIPTGATTVRHMDTRALVESSQEIVIGRVVTVTVRWDERRSKILTDAVIEVDRRLKGAPGNRVHLVTLGGELDGVRYTVPGCATFRSGEEALLFVWRDRSGRAQVNALGQGKFDIVREATSGRATIQRNLPGLAVGDVRSLQPVAQGKVAPRIGLDEMVAEIERLVANERAENKR